jgi:ELWxxDGT repeat protein
LNPTTGINDQTELGTITDGSVSGDTILIRLSRSLLTQPVTIGGAAQPAPVQGNVFTNVKGETRLLIGGGGSGLITVIDDSTPSEYTVRTHQACEPNQAPTARLAAMPQAGFAPLEVEFNGSASSDPDAADGVVEYTFDFGDGTPPVTQSSPEVEHTYTAAGNYHASLTVKDTHGKASTNSAGMAIQVMPEGDFYTVNPCRLLDTRTQQDGSAPVQSGTDRVLNVVGITRCGISPLATAVAINVTVTQTTGAGYLTSTAVGQWYPFFMVSCSTRRAALALFLFFLASICQADLVPRLVRDIDPASYAGSSSPRQFSELRHGMAFTVRGRELWVYDDQNDAFTRALQRAEIRQLRGNLYAAREASGDWTFWYAQGFPYFNAVPATTERVSRLGAVYPDPQGIGPLIFEAARKGSARALWAFGPKGPVEIARPLPLEDGRLLRDWTPRAPKSYFIARHRTLGTALWATDGTQAGTSPVVAPSPGRTIPLLLAGDLRGRLLLAISGGEPELWWSDGTSRRLRPFFEIVRGPGAATVTEARVVEGRAFLVVADARRGRQLWTSDGTAAGTRPLTRFARDPLRAIGLPLLYEAGLWYFAADDGVHGRELWQTDGTPQGTRLVSDVCPGPCSGDPRDLSYEFFLDSPPGLVFTAATPEGPRALWRSDGTQEGTVRLTPPGVVAATGLQLGQFFAAADAESGEELWITDGSPETTRLWEDLEREANGGSAPIPLGAAEDRLIFQTYGSSVRYQLWSSDGTAAGTFRLPAPRGPRMSAADVLYGTSLGDLFIFVGSPRGNPSIMWALWATDGTTAPIVRLTPPGVVMQSIPLTIGSRVLFFATDPVHGTELWTTDGTPRPPASSPISRRARWRSTWTGSHGCAARSSSAAGTTATTSGFRTARPGARGGWSTPSPCSRLSTPS